MSRGGVENTTIDRNIEQQRQWYGEPVGDTVRRLTATLDLTQRDLASAVGLSAPMLSQLASGQRGKIANPVVLRRLEALNAIAADPLLEQYSRAELARRIKDVHDNDTTVHNTGSMTGRGSDAVQALLRAVAAADEVAGAAALIDDTYPRIAEVLRVYGLGRTADAREHFAAAVDGA